MKEFTCVDCGLILPDASDHIASYGYNFNSETICFNCCGKQDIAYMQKHDNVKLYLAEMDEQDEGYVVWDKSMRFGNGGSYKLTNWPGTVSIPVRFWKRSNHNMARHRIDVWFHFDGSLWHGYNIGDFNQIAHCSRTKRVGNSPDVFKPYDYASLRNDGDAE